MNPLYERGALRFCRSMKWFGQVSMEVKDNYSSVLQSSGLESVGDDTCLYVTPSPKCVHPANACRDFVAYRENVLG